MNINDRFELYNDDHLKFEKVENKKSTRPDLHAFITLDKFFPNYGSDIISAAEHDEIFIDLEEKHIEKLSDGQILELVRCGVFYNEEYDCLGMFV